MECETIANVNFILNFRKNKNFSDFYNWYTDFITRSLM